MVLGRFAIIRIYCVVLIKTMIKCAMYVKLQKLQWCCVNQSNIAVM